MNKITDIGAELLSSAIVERAAEDYLSVKETRWRLETGRIVIEDDVKEEMDVETKETYISPYDRFVKDLDGKTKELVDFFKSEWFGMLSSVDGDKFIKLLDTVTFEERKKKILEKEEEERKKKEEEGNKE